MATSRKRSSPTRWVAACFFGLYALRVHILAFLAYSCLLAWLFLGGVSSIEPGDVLPVSDTPNWSPPTKAAWFGTSWTGHDQFQLSRVAMFHSIAISVVAAGIGVFIALIVGAVVSSRPTPMKFLLLKQLSEIDRALPVFVVLLILAAGSQGNTIVLVVSLSIVVAVFSVGQISTWYKDLLNRNDITSGVAAGLSRSGIVKKRMLPLVAKRIPGLAGQVIPRLVLIEMALSFFGFCDDQRLSCGTLVRLGRNHLVEAPWLTVWPGAFAGVTLVVLSLLGWSFAKLVRAGRYPFI